MNGAESEGEVHLWDDAYWIEETDAKSPWARGCRWLQSWWREVEIGCPPGEWKPVAQDKEPRRTKRVASMLPVGTDWQTNFLSPEAAAVAQDLGRRHSGGIVDEDRLRRNLLASQPACVNLFAPLASHPEVLRRWLRHAVPRLPDGLEIESVEFEWAPQPAEHFGGGSAFDAFITYRSGGKRGFVAVETKYAEHLASQAPKRIRQPYIGFTESRAWWRPGAEIRLLDPATRQFWLNTLLAQSLVERGTEAFDEGVAIVVSCAADDDALSAAVAVAAEQVEDATEPAAVRIHWSSYEEILDAAENVSELAKWRAAFRRRYLDFSPVAHKLPADDPRLNTVDRYTSAVDGLRERLELARAVSERVTGAGSVAQEVVDSPHGRASTVDLLVAARRLDDSVEALKSARRRLAPDP